MDKLPKFVRHPANKIARSSQATPGVVGYVFDEANGTQIAFWTCAKTASSAEHVHDYDEYMVVVQGCYTLIINGERIQVEAGKEYVIPRGIPHSGEVVAGTDPRIRRPSGRSRAETLLPAHGYEPEGREFESLRARHFS
jgi:quercetin dioxygenase-like cupin family protein